MQHGDSTTVSGNCIYHLLNYSGKCVCVPLEFRFKTPHPTHAVFPVRYELNLYIPVQYDTRDIR
jgi:hypothetical protein